MLWGDGPARTIQPKFPFPRVRVGTALNYVESLSEDQGLCRPTVLCIWWNFQVGMQVQNPCEDAVIVLEEQRNGQLRGSFEDGELARDSVLRSICGGDAANSGEKVFTVDIGNDIELPALLTATVSRPSAGNTTLQDPVVSIRSACTQACSEMACSTGQVDPNNPLVRSVHTHNCSNGRPVGWHLCDYR